MERLRGNHTLSAALTGLTAAVVGVIADLGLYFAVHTFFTSSHTVTAGPPHLVVPHVGGIRPVPVGIAVVAAVLIFRFRWSVVRVLGVSAALGLTAALAGLSRQAGSRACSASTHPNPRTK